MTPSELLKMAGYCRLFANDVAAALRSYAELLQSLETIHASEHCGADVMTPERILAWAREIGE